jgi:hypothetical protein
MISLSNGLLCLIYSTKLQETRGFESQIRIRLDMIGSLYTDRDEYLKLLFSVGLLLVGDVP